MTASDSPLSATDNFPTDADSATAFAFVWQRLSADLQAALPALLAEPNDSEALHDFRVALRKSRALLSLCPAKLAGRRHFERAFHRLADATGPLRDLDVLLQKIRHTPAVDNARTSLEISLMAQRTDAQNALLDTLRHCDFDALIDDWQRWLAAFPQREELRARWRIPAMVSVDVLVRDQSLELLRRGSRIDRDSSPKALHKLRIRAKRLRYLLQGFLPLFDEHHYRPLVQALTDLQDLLGKHQDAVVMKQQLRHNTEVLERSGLLTEESAALIDHWQRRARKKRRKARKAFPAALQAFADASARL